MVSLRLCTGLLDRKIEESALAKLMCVILFFWPISFNDFLLYIGIKFFFYRIFFFSIFINILS